MTTYYKAEFEFGTEVRKVENNTYSYATFRAGTNAKGVMYFPKVTYHSTLELANSGKMIVEVVPVIEIDKAEYKAIKAGVKS
jgi:hypothetical protein